MEQPKSPPFDDCSELDYCNLVFDDFWDLHLLPLLSTIMHISRILWQAIEKYEKGAIPHVGIGTAESVRPGTSKAVEVPKMSDTSFVPPQNQPPFVIPLPDVEKGRGDDFRKHPA